LASQLLLLIGELREQTLDEFDDGIGNPARIPLRWSHEASW
jgi:hypothetical protein